MAIGKALLKTIGVSLAVGSIPLRALFWSGIPSNARLRLIMISPWVRRRRIAARTRLHERLNERAAFFSLSEIGFQEVDSAFRAPRLTFEPEPHRSALACELRLTGYFTAPRSYDLIVPEIIDRIAIGDLGDLVRVGPDRRLGIAEGAQLSVLESARNDPGAFREGALSLNVHDADIREALDWSIPDRRTIKDYFTPRRRRDISTIRRRAKWTPGQEEISGRLRAEGKTVIAWSASLHYYRRPKRLLF